MNQFKKALLVYAYALLTVAVMTAQKRATSPTAQLTHAIGDPDSVILKSGHTPDEVKRIPVLHSYALTDLRRQSALKFGDRQIDLKPFLNNPRAIPNVAAKMQAASQLVKVRSTTSTVSEVAQGVLIESDLQFSFASGACSNSASRTAIDNLGVHCPELASLSSKEMGKGGRGTSNARASISGSATNRAKYVTYFKQQDSLIQQHIATLRAALKDPNKNAKLVAAVGQAKVDQMNALTDDQIRDNIASSGVQRMHETMFVPKAAMAKLPQELMNMHANPSKPNKAAPVAQMANQEPSQTLGPDIYLTGFTLGNHYEWGITIGFDLDPCLLGLDLLTDGLASVVSSIFGVSPCPIHASVSPWVSFDYGFGMRFPLETTMKYQRQGTGKNTTANVTVNFQPINGSEAQYAQAGLDKSLIFKGQEFVAFLDPKAGMGYDLPIAGTGNATIVDVPLDFTQYLPAPYTGGNFAPPAPGQFLPSSPITITSFDFFANLLDIATLQATLNPAIEVGLISHGMSFELDDKMYKGKNGTNVRQTSLTKSGTTVPLATDPKDHSTDFLLTNPVYNVGLQITPGLLLNLTVDLGVWSQTWNPAIWISQLSVDIPANGINFGCHEETTCTHEYQQNAGQAKVTEVTVAEVVKQIQAQGCDGPGRDSQFYCRSNAAWDNCLAHVSATPYKGCGLDTADQLNQVLKSLDCANGYCKTLNKVMTPIGCPAGVSQCSHETNIQACKRVITDPGMQKFGYTTCCMNPSIDPSAKGCVSMPAPAPAPRVDGGKNPTSTTPTGTPVQTPPKTTTPTTGGTTPPTPHLGQSPTHEPNHPTQNVTPVPTAPAKPAAPVPTPAKVVAPAATKPAVSTPPPATNTPTPAAKKSGTTATTKPGTPPQK